MTEKGLFSTPILLPPPRAVYNTSTPRISWLSAQTPMYQIYRRILHTTLRVLTPKAADCLAFWLNHQVSKQNVARHPG